MNENEGRKEDVGTKEAIKVVPKAIIISVLLSSAGLVVAPIPAYSLLLLGIAVLPLWISVPIVYGGIIACGVVPGIYVNIYITRKLPLPYRIAAIIFHIAVFSPIAYKLFVWGFGGRHW